MCGSQSDDPSMHDQSPGEIANPGWSYRLPQDGTLLMGPCDTPGCFYMSKPGGYRHDGECSEDRKGGA